MQDQQETRRLPLGTIAGISAALLVVGGGSAWWAWNSNRSSTGKSSIVAPESPTVPSQGASEPLLIPLDPSLEDTSQQPVPSESPQQTAQPTAPQTAQPAQPSSTQANVQVYWLKYSNNAIELTPKTVALEKAGSKSEALTGAFERLFAGPSDANVESSIPQGTELRNLSVESDGIHVDLSEEFTLGGGSASMMSRLQQVVYTATSLEPNAKVWIDVEGRPLKVLGGEGIMVKQPTTRQDMESNFEF